MIPDPHDAVTTFGGIGLAIFSMVIKDIVRDRLAGKNEKLKFSELARQTKHLDRLVKLARQDREQARKANKKVSRKLAVIHDDVVTVKHRICPHGGCQVRHSQEANHNGK